MIKEILLVSGLIVMTIFLMHSLSETNSRYYHEGFVNGWIIGNVTYINHEKGIINITTDGFTQTRECNPEYLENNTEYIFTVKFTGSLDGAYTGYSLEYVRRNCNSWMDRWSWIDELKLWCGIHEYDTRIVGNYSQRTQMTLE